jgi:hypothetical protein
MLNWLTSIKDRWRYPNFRDFISMGLGIEARHKRCQKYWAAHLDLCKQFQRQALEDLPAGGAVAILGAGRLLDVDIDLVTKKFSAVDLYDADPKVLRSKSQLLKSNSKISVRCFVEDVTGCLADWTAQLKQILIEHPGNLKVLTNFFIDLNASTKYRLHSQYQAILSVNLLSQICLYWRDRVHQLLSQTWGFETDDQGNYEGPVQEALEESMAKLQAQHLDLLSSAQSDRILLITDRYFHYYTSDQAPWMTEPALWIPNAETRIELQDYEVIESSSWLWHIAPQGIEQEDYGSIHEVIASAFKKSASGLVAIGGRGRS